MLAAQTRKNYQRARSDDEKGDRRSAILSAASRHILENGVDGFTMNSLAKAADVAKGTLYLYFATKEELLLALYRQRLGAFCDALSRGLVADMDDGVFCDLFFDSADADPLFLDLSSRLSNVIEQNVSAECLIASKRDMAAFIAPVAAKMEECLNLTSGGGLQLATALMALLIGASQVGANPNLDRTVLPDDVVQILDNFACSEIFVASAGLIVKAMRREDK